MEWYVVGYGAIAAVALAWSALLSLQAWEHLRFSRSRIRRPKRIGPEGEIAVIVACKGAEAELAGNLTPLFEQTHPHYQIVFVVESADDAACATIRRLIEQYPRRRARIVIAGLATGSGQKVHNLLAATRDLDPEVAYLAFVDADVRPTPRWLYLLTQRLDDFDAASGYRRFVPRRPTLANSLLASMDSAVVSVMFPGIHQMVWGGSWAIRRSVFEQIGLREAWQGTLSDDLVASGLLSRHRASVTLEPASIVASPLDVDWSGARSFVKRQFTIGRIYAPTLWTLALTLNCSSAIALWGGAAGAVAGCMTQAAWTPWPAAVAALLYALHVLRAVMRQRAARYYLPSEYERLSTVRRFDVFWGPVAALACCLGLLASAGGRTIRWKGIVYEMSARGRVGAIRREDIPLQPTRAASDFEPTNRRALASRA